MLRRESASKDILGSANWLQTEHSHTAALENSLFRLSKFRSRGLRVAFASNDMWFSVKLLQSEHGHC